MMRTSKQRYALEHHNGSKSLKVNIFKIKAITIFVFKEEKEAKPDEADKSEDSDEEDATNALYGMSRTAAKYLSKSKFLPRMYLKASRIQDVTKAHAHEVIKFLKIFLSFTILGKTWRSEVPPNTTSFVACFEKRSFIVSSLQINR